MARKATGTKEWRNRMKTWVGRVYIDGVRSGWEDLQTTDPQVAEQRLQEWLESGEPPSQAGKELFRVASERILKKQEAMKETAGRRHRLRAYCYPRIGHIEVRQLKPSNVHAVLEGMNAQRAELLEQARAHGAEAVAKAHDLSVAGVDRWLKLEEAGQLVPFAVDTVHHMRVDISRVLGALVLEDAIPGNVAEHVELPDDVEYDDRPFVVLNDEEVRRFFRRGFESELMMCCLLSREFGGQRTSDLIGADWSHYDLVNWQANIKRPKTDAEGTKKYKKRRKRRVTLMYERVWLRIPEHVRAPLIAWRETQRDPVTGALPVSGPLFPARRGKNAGKRKASRGNSWAASLRDALWEEGIIRPLPGYETAVGDARRQFCALQVDTDDTRRAVFHSFRRASVTALRKAGVPLRLAMLITGHSSESVHMGYDAADEAIEIPAGSLALGGEPSPAPSPSPPPSPAPAPGAASFAPPAPLAAPPRRAAVSPALEPAGELGGPVAALTGELLGVPPAMVAGGEAVSAAVAALMGQIGALLSAASTAGGALPPPASNGPNSPRFGLNPGISEANSPPISEGFQRRAPVGSNHRPADSKATAELASDGKGSEGVTANPPLASGAEQAIARNPGYSPEGAEAPAPAVAQLATERIGSDASAPSSAGASQAQPLGGAPDGALEALRAAAHRALADGNWTLLDSLRPVIEAEERRAADERRRASANAPVSLEVARARREERGGRR